VIVPATVPILLYHSISADADPRFRRWTVPPQLFAEHMTHLVEDGYHTYTVNEYGRWLRGELELADPAAVITFDDGFRDFATEALPVLREHALESTLYVSTAYVGGTSQWLEACGESLRSMLTWDELAAIGGDDLEIGAHGHTHRMFDTIPLVDAVADIARSKELLESRTGRAIETLAYPHGYSTPALRHHVAGLGFSTACGVKHALSSAGDDQFSLSRIIVGPDTDRGTFDALLHGSGLRTSPPSSSPTISGWRAYRRLRSRIRRPHSKTGV
jgi:peptidoglycan/xylan/chitin deacetylase (PgdA/CDA1 family)